MDKRQIVNNLLRTGWNKEQIENAVFMNPIEDIIALSHVLDNILPEKWTEQKVKIPLTSIGCNEKSKNLSCCLSLILNIFSFLFKFISPLIFS